MCALHANGHWRNITVYLVAICGPSNFFVVHNVLTLMPRANNSIIKFSMVFKSDSMIVDSA